jgi:hypothetical protein
MSELFAVGWVRVVVVVPAGRVNKAKEFGNPEVRNVGPEALNEEPALKPPHLPERLNDGEV